MLSATLKNGYIDCMNLVLLMVDIPEQACTRAHFDIEYLSNGVERPDGKASIEIWENTFSGEDSGRYYSAIDYVKYGVVSPHDGWIEIEDTTTTTATTPSTKTGDIDGDEDIDIVDVLSLNQYLLGIYDIPEENQPAADVDKDGFITDADSLIILKSLVGLAKL